MAKTIEIAPRLEEIRREGNVFRCDFNGMAIRWAIAADCGDMSEQDEENLKKWLQSAIGMSGKLWQVPWLLNKNLPFASEVYVNDKIVEFPKED